MDDNLIRKTRADLREFYNRPDMQLYGREELPEYLIKQILLSIARVKRGRWKDILVLDLGCGRGALQNIHPGYIGLDISFWALTNIESRNVNRVCASGEELPFISCSIDFIVSIAMLEHLPEPALCIEEIHRTLADGGIVFLSPAWFCRKWNAEALHVIPYKQLNWMKKIVKMTIPFRELRYFRGIRIIPLRIIREIRWHLGIPISIISKRLKPNTREFIHSDSDASSSIEPHSVLLYFLNRNYELIKIPGVPRLDTFWRRIFMRGNIPIIVAKPISE